MDQLQFPKPLTVAAARRYSIFGYLVLRIANCIIHIYLLCPQYLCDCAGLFAVCVSGVSTSNTAAVAAPAGAEIKHQQWPHCPVIDDQDSDFKP